MDGILVDPAAFKAVVRRAERLGCVRFAHISANFGGAGPDSLQSILAVAAAGFLERPITMASQHNSGLLSALPQVEEVLRRPELVTLQEGTPRAVVVESVRDAIRSAREGILSGQTTQASVEDIAAAALRKAHAANQASLRPVINATGVILHTNLGRSPLASEAIDAMAAIAGRYSTLEYDISEQSRGSRQDHYERLVCMLTGAEAAFAVNNNAAAVLLVLSEFAAHKEAVISRGEMVEVGGSFRIPDIMECSQATMVEVGCTNKTHAEDFRRAITGNTAMLVKVHTSNYRMVGFTESVDAQELCALAAAERQRRIDEALLADEDAARAVAEANSRGGKQRFRNERAEGLENEILVYEDLGSGAFLKPPCAMEADEPTVAESLATGCDLVSFSGDKLLGGPQAGIIVGSAELIGRLKQNPLARALRLDKLSIAALEATLRLYLDEEQAAAKIPTLRMLNASAEDMRVQAEALHDRFAKSLPPGSVALAVIAESSVAGGGALPMCDIDGFALSVRFIRGSAQDCERFLAQEWETPIVARIKKDAVLFDPRTLVGQAEADEVVRAMAAYLATAPA